MPQYYVGADLLTCFVIFVTSSVEKLWAEIIKYA